MKRRLDPRQLAALVGLVAAVVVAVLVNVLGSRHYKRWDVTTNQRYTLSPATLETLHSLKEPVEVWVLLGAADPLEGSVKQLLTVYRAETNELVVHEIDPDHDVAQLKDVQQRFKIETGLTKEGHVVADTIVVVSRGEHHWFLGVSDMVEVAAGDETRVKPREERAFTGAIRSVLGAEKTRLCFTTGHGEAGPLDPSDRGAGVLRDVLEKDNYEVVAVDVTAPNASLPYEGCAAVVVCGPQVPFTNDEAERLRTWATGGGNVLVAAGPLSGDTASGIVGINLERVTAPFGIHLDEDLVVEKDPRLAFPGELGTRFLVEAKEHPVTAALVRTDNGKDVPAVMFRFARSMTKVAAAGAAHAEELLVTSPSAYGLTNVAGAADWKEAPEKRAGDMPGPLVTAMAAERPKLAPSSPHGPRLVAIGSSSALTATSLRESGSERGAALLAESAISWLTSRPQVLDVPERAAVAAGIHITDESRSSITTYVLVLMPLSVALLGVVIGLWRRNVEKKPAARRRKKKAR